MQICKCCKQKKEDSEFRWRKLGVKRHTTCKVCLRSYYQKRYSDDKERYYNTNKQGQQRRWEVKQEWLVKYLQEHPCVRCGYTDIRALEFHHEQGVKEFQISEMLRSYALKRIQAEMEKCVVLCANCHNIQTAIDNNSYRHRLVKK
jgi:hypothetical protein